jgi:hypothetical protein
MAEVRDVRDRNDERKAYSKPSLTDYGRVEEITKGSGITGNDYGPGFSMP